MALRPTSEVVAVAWLKSIPYLGTSVATRLPSDNQNWAASGFCTAVMAGGSPDGYVPWALPVISVQAWGVSPSGGRPPWNQAAQIMEQVRMAALDHTYGGLGRGKLTTLPAGYSSAFVHVVRPLTEPRRIEDDDSAYANYQMDLEMRWTAGP